MLRCLVFSLLALSLQAAPKPNILWLIAEDFGPHLGCYGEAQVQTPHLDGLAARGMRHERFYTTAPVCSPSRSALNTGMYQTRIGAHNHRSHRDDGFTLPAGVQLLSQRLRAAGYFTANLKQLPKPADFGGSGKTDWNFSHDPKPFDGENWEDLRSHQPFYAQLNFQETHRSFHAPAKVDPAKVKLPPYYPDHEITRRDWAQYLDSAMELDRKVGLVLELLKRDGLADNTIVCFFADNGAAHVRAKQFCYEEGLQVPFILYWPAALNPPADYQAGQVSRRLLLVWICTPLRWIGPVQRCPQISMGRCFWAHRLNHQGRWSLVPAIAAMKPCCACAARAMSATATSSILIPASRCCCPTPTRRNSTRCGI